MSAGYADIDIRPSGDLSLAARFRLENHSKESWRAGEGFRVSYQLFDPETSAFIEDGPRSTISRDLAPGESEALEIDVRFPPANGRYRVFVSPMREDVCWHYDHGWPFLMIDVVVESHRAAAVNWTVTGMRALRRRLFARSLGRAFALPLQSIWANRGLIRSMARRDIAGRYRGSFGGLFWTLLNPLLLMLTYFFVFGIVLQTRFAGDPSRSGFVLYFLAGMLPWLPFSEAAGRAPFVMLDHRNFVKKLVFPLEILPVTQVAAGLVTQAFALAIFLVLLVAARGSVPVSVCWLPVLLVPQVLFTLGLCWFLAALGVYVRDLGQVSGFLLTLWFFLTPICYPEASLPQATLGLLSKNPMFVLVRGYRDILLEGAAPAFSPLWKLWLLAAFVFFAGYAWFHKLRKSFADVI